MVRAKVENDPSIAEKKERAIAYFREVPVFRYTAMHIGVDEDTLLLWRKADSEFSEQLDLAKSEWVTERVKKVKPDFALERLEREIFSPPKQQTEISGGEDPIKIILGKYGLPGGLDDRKDDDPVSGPSENSI